MSVGVEELDEILHRIFVLIHRDCLPIPTRDSECCRQRGRGRVWLGTEIDHSTASRLGNCTLYLPIAREFRRDLHVAVLSSDSAICFDDLLVPLVHVCVEMVPGGLVRREASVIGVADRIAAGFDPLIDRCEAPIIRL